MKSTIISLVLLFPLGLASFSLPSRASSISSNELDSVSARFQKMKFPGTGQDLHLSSYKFADGVKGSNIEIIDEYPAIEGSGKFKNNEEEIFHSEVCSADLITLGTKASDEAVLSKSKDQIYTISRFQQTDIVRSNNSSSSTIPILVTQLGGEVKDGTELLRMQIVNSQKLMSGSSYLLFLKKEPKASNPVFYLQRAIKITDGRIYPQRKWLGITSGTPYGEIKDRISAVQSIEPCR